MTGRSIVNDGGKWRLDTAAGKEELMYRRIGHNEVGAIAACRGFIDAEKDYAAVAHDGLLAGIYAQKLMSTPGKQDGLYWLAKEDEPASPAGPFLAEARDIWRKDWEESRSRITGICSGFEGTRSGGARRCEELFGRWKFDGWCGAGGVCGGVSRERRDDVHH